MQRRKLGQRDQSQEADPTHPEGSEVSPPQNELVVATGEGIVRGFGMDSYTVLCLKWVIHQDLL